MNHAEAQELLGVESGATPEVIKKAYRKKAAKYHPDTCKDKDAADKFKNVTDAYNFLTKPRAPFEINRAIQFPPLTVNVTLPFVDAILGCKHTVELQIKTRCETCLGNGIFDMNGTCLGCQGRKMVNVNMGSGMSVMTTCNRCFGSGKLLEPCSDCRGECVTTQQKTIHVKIPGGMADGQTIRVLGQGHFTCGMFGKTTDPLFVKIAVTPDPKMKMMGINVHSQIVLPLRDAVHGKELEVDTVHGKRKITIPKLCRHRDQVVIQGDGAVTPHGTGNHVCELDIQYPDNISDLISKSE